jgi:hypothetical protein
VSIKFYFLPSSLIANVAPKIIDKNAVPQNNTINEPAKGVNEKPPTGTKELRLILP